MQGSTLARASVCVQLCDFALFVNMCKLRGLHKVVSQAHKDITAIVHLQAVMDSHPCNRHSPCVSGKLFIGHFITNEGLTSC